MTGLLCRLLNRHRCRYVEGDEAEIRAECVRLTCDYEKELTEEWYETRKRGLGVIE